MTEISELQARLRRLEDREEIRDLVARYGRAVDDRDWVALADQYTSDAVFDSAGGRSVGREAVIDYYRERTERFSSSYHYPHSHEITFNGDDEATGLVCAHAEMAIGGDTIWVALRYHDHYRRHGGRWRFHQRATRRLYAMKLADLPTGMADRLRIRYPDDEPALAQLGADIDLEQSR
jgi:ketosteroid isomerase-like protein